MEPFTQILDPMNSVAGSTLAALIPVAVLPLLLAVFRISAWQAVIIGSAVTIILAVTIWDAPVSNSLASYGLGAATGLWAVDWIVFWGVIIYNTMVVTGAFEDFKRWMIRQATADIRVQTLLMAWAFGALMEGLVGFGYPWAVVAPILIALGVADLAAIRVAGAVESSWKFAPFVAGTAILVSWILILAVLRPSGRQLGQVFRDTWHQMWGALLVGPFIFGLAFVFSYSGMASSMANGFSKVGTSFILLAPVLGWIAVALSGSNTSSNAVFGQFHDFQLGARFQKAALCVDLSNRLGTCCGARR